MNSNLTSILYEERFYLKIGSTWLTDSINLFLTFPIGLIGLVLNIFSFFVLAKIKIKCTKLYDYLKIYSLNSAFICIISSSTFMSYSPRFFPYYLEYFAMLGRCKITAFLLATPYLFGNILDIIIGLERMSIFNVKIKKIEKFIKPIHVTLVSLTISSLINLPLVFTHYIRSKEEIIMGANYNLNNFALCGQTEFLKNYMTAFLLPIIFRDIITLILEIFASLATIYYYKRYDFKGRQVIRNSNVMPQIQSTRREETGNRLFLMTIWMSIISIISHFITFITYISPLIPNLYLSYTYFVLASLATLSICLKHFSNFFLFYLFNLNFRNSISTRN